jgi:tetratricopeptide (TPR) repeat protein
MDPATALRDALQHLEAGRPARCVRLCNALLEAQPGAIQALYLRGCAAFETGDLGTSVSDLTVVHAGHPEHLHAAYYLGRSLRAAGRPDDALAPLQAALGAEGLEMHARYELAVCLSQLRRRPEAIEHYLAILDGQPGHVQAAANLAALLERENRLGEAGQWADRALSTEPRNETAQMTRAVLDRRAGDLESAARRLRELVDRIDDPVNRSLAWNQLGQCLDASGAWDEAFAAFEESNRILRAHHPHARPDPRGPHGLETLERIAAWLEGRPMAGWTAPEPASESGIAFLVGFPRSGTTLLDRMLAAHSDIEVLEEKSLFAPLHQDWSAPGTLEALSDINPAQLADARSIYRQEISRYRRAPEKSLVIDKLPLNLAYLFLIHRLFPEAPVIFLQRHPLDACLSCFFQPFELVASMAYFLDLESTARYYDAVMKVATLSVDQIGNPVHAVRYEDLVARPRDALQGLLGFLGRDWDEAVLDHRRTAAAVASDTPSYQQVSQPLYTRSIGRWRHYRQRLEPVFPILLSWVKRLGYG